MKVAMARSRPLEKAGAPAFFTPSGEYFQKHSACPNISLGLAKYYPRYVLSHHRQNIVASNATRLSVKHYG
jgi:hypothetical protein